MSLEGILIKGYGGFYYVKTESNVWKCHLRGKHRFNKKDFLPGDRVKFRERGNNVGIVEELLPRKNRLLRPPVANVDQVVIIVALDQPKPDRMLLDRLLLMTESAGINVLICFSKVDLIKKDLPVMLPEIYRRIGYHVYLTSATGEGKEHLVRACKGKISVFAGASGVGKSSLLNTLQEGLCLNTASVSEKNKRGRHTTRNVELLELENGGLVADTPGFNRLFLPKKVTRRDLAYFFPEMRSYLFFCKFSTCLHDQEPECAVKEAVSEGKIDEIRYNHYLEFLKEVIQRERNYKHD